MFKYRKSIGEAERHYLIIEMTVLRSKGSFPFVSRFDLIKIVSSPKFEGDPTTLG
jgi:hypothetical protein